MTAALPVKVTDPVCECVSRPTRLPESMSITANLLLLLAKLRAEVKADPEQVPQAHTSGRPAAGCRVHLPDAPRDLPDRSRKLSYLRNGLEPKEITLDDKPDPEFVDMKRRFWISQF